MKLVTLLLLISLSAFSQVPGMRMPGSSNNGGKPIDGDGNGGNGVEGKLQYLAQTRVLDTYFHSKNANVTTAEEREAIKALVAQGLPFVSVDPAKLDNKRYTDKKGNTALIDEGKPERRARLLDNLGNIVDARVVFDRKENRYIIQWDEKSLLEITQQGHDFPDDFIRDVAHEVWRYGYHVEKLPRNDDMRAITRHLYVPPIPETPLPSASYRFDFPRRYRELTVQTEGIIRSLSTDLKNHSMAPSLITVYQAQLSNLRSYAKYTNDDRNPELIATSLDRFERGILEQNRRIEKQKNLGKEPLESVSETSSRYDFPLRAKILQSKTQRVIDAVAWNQNLRSSRYWQGVAHRLQEIGPHFRDYRRSEWPVFDEETAKQFDAWEEYLGLRLKELP